MLKFVAKGLAFTAYMAFLVGILLSLKELVINYTDFSSWITPTICYFLTRLKVDLLLSSYIAFASANWLKSKVVNYWTN